MMMMSPNPNLCPMNPCPNPIPMNPGVMLMLLWAVVVMSSMRGSMANKVLFLYPNLPVGRCYLLVPCL